MTSLNDLKLYKRSRAYTSGLEREDRILKDTHLVDFVFIGLGSLLHTLPRYTPILPFSFALHTSNITHPLILEKEALKIPKHNLKSVGEHAFSFIAPSVEFTAFQSAEPPHSA